MSEPSNASRTREINETIRYTMWSVFRLDEPLGPDDADADRAAEAAEVDDNYAAFGPAAVHPAIRPNHGRVVVDVWSDRATTGSR